MDYFAVYSSDVPPDLWAQQREAEGWAGVALADHIDYGGQGWWHPFSSLGAMASRTQRVRLTTAFANNLFRSPVEVAQAALTLHALSDGRFEVGLGAGWAAEEIIGASLDYPEPRDRAQRFKEAVIVIRDLLAGHCRFDGNHYQIDLQAVGPPADSPPRLGAALGGEWTTRHIGPLLDHIEIAPMGPALRGGTFDHAVLGSTTVEDVHACIDRARQANTAAAIGLSVFIAVGDGPMVSGMKRAFANGFATGLAGPPAQVADALRALDHYEIDRVTIVPSVSRSIELLTPELMT